MRLFSLLLAIAALVTVTYVTVAAPSDAAVFSGSMRTVASR